MLHTRGVLKGPQEDQDTGVETDYAVGDYRLSATFVKYAALLAQDTATIGTVNYVRGEEIPNIASEEAATQIQDDNNNLVFTQWTPYTVVETKTLRIINKPPIVGVPFFAIICDSGPSSLIGWPVG